MTQKNLQRPKLWTRYFIAVILMEVILSMAMTVMDNVLAIYADDVTGSKSYGGQLTTAFTFGAIALSPFVGRLIDRRGRQKVAVVGLALYAAICFACMLTDEKAVFLSLRVVQGFAKAIAQITVVVMAADVIPKERMAEGLGYDSLGFAISFAIGPTIAMALLGDGRYDLVFGTCGCLLLLAVGLCLTMNYEKTGRYELEMQADDGRRGIKKFVEPTALPGALVRFFGNFAAACVIVFVMLFATSVLGYNNLQMSGFFFCASAGMLISRLFGRVIDRHDPLIILIPALLMMTVCLLLLALGAREYYVLYLIAGLCFGLEEGSAYPGLRAVAVLDAPGDRKGVVNSMLDFAMDGGIMLGSFVLGFVIDAGSAPDQYDGFQTMFLIGAVCAVLAAVFAAIFYNKKARAKRVARYNGEGA